MRLFWTNTLQPSVLQIALPTFLLPFPALNAMLKPHHVPVKLGHNDHPPFAMHNKKGGERLCMPTIVSYLEATH